MEPRVYREMGLNDAEYEQILGILHREPTLTELGMFAVMWSEHCGYKYSRPVLALFKTYKEAQEKGQLENAGVIPLDETLGIVFKVESHNHPSAVEPFQGAATGVGGILRDIFTMGARPIANLNSLRFGPLEEPRNRYLFEHVVSGISHYGNCLIGEETFLWRDSSGVHFDTIGNFVEQRLSKQEDTLDISRDSIQTLSMNPESGKACWRSVQQVFRRRASTLLHIHTAMGRRITVTPDHQVYASQNGAWRVCSASDLKVGDELPLLVRLPACAEENTLPPKFDLIALLEQHEQERQNIFVSLPSEWQPTAEARAALRALVSSPARRHCYLRERRFPLETFLQLEPLLGVIREEVCLFRRGKANHMRAVIQPNAAFARLLGYYLSEGCVSANSNTYKIIFTFALHECEYVKEVACTLQQLGLRVCIERRTSTIAVSTTSWLLGWLLKEVWQCGINAHSKTLPSFFWNWSTALKREGLKGLLRGDGSLTTKTHGHHAKISFATVSRTLFEQVLMLVQDAGAIPLIYSRPGGVGQIRGRTVYRKAIWQMEVCNVQGLTALSDVFGEERNAQLANALDRYKDVKSSFPRYRIENDLALVKIQSIETEVANEVFVYDVEVEDTHLFVSSGSMVTHNCVGVPTVAGEVYFHPCYSGNPLVNAMAVGVVERKKIASAAAKGVGNPVIYVGSATGKDGIHGATFASAELDEESESKRPNVQMGDPFMEKLLIEATLEALATGYVVGIQDMGAAGLTCSTCETAAKADNGMEIDVRKVPLREADMTSYEIMLSESQERMLCIAQKGSEQRVMEVFRKWGLNAAVVGHVTDDGLVRIKDNGEVVAEIPAKALTDQCPVYSLQTEEPAYIQQLQAFDLQTVPEPTDYAEALLTLLDSPSIASKEWVTEQYDSMVQTQTVFLPGADAAVLRIRGTRKGIAVKLDGNGRYGYLDPYVGGMIAVAEAARNVACVGAKPAAVTDNLNFANPEKPTGFWQFRRSVEGIAQATEAFGTPVVSGNVSFYNETPDGPIFPTPTIGMLGILEDVAHHCQAAFRAEGEGDILVLLTAYDDPTGGLGGSEYLSRVHGIEAGVPPLLDLAGEKRLHNLLLSCISEGLFASCHDVSDGGLAVCLAESAMLGNIGAFVLLNPADFPPNLSPAALLFGEAQGRVVVSVRTEKQFVKLKERAERNSIRATWIGTVGGENLRLSQGPNILFDLSVSHLATVSRTALPRRMQMK